MNYNLVLEWLPSGRHGDIYYSFNFKLNSLIDLSMNYHPNYKKYIGYINGRRIDQGYYSLEDLHILEMVIMDKVLLISIDTSVLRDRYDDRVDKYLFKKE